MHAAGWSSRRIFLTSFIRAALAAAVTFAAPHRINGGWIDRTSSDFLHRSRRYYCTAPYLAILFLASALLFRSTNKRKVLPLRRSTTLATYTRFNKNYNKLPTMDHTMATSCRWQAVASAGVHWPSCPPNTETRSTTCSAAPERSIEDDEIKNAKTYFLVCCCLDVSLASTARCLAS